MDMYRKFLILISLSFLSVLFNSNVHATGTTLIYSDNFELGLGNWTNVTVGDNRNWTRDYGGTPSTGTGPSSGAGSSNYYMYLETSSGSAYSLGDSAILQSPSVSGSNLHLHFQYHMYGANTGTLAVDVFYNGNWINNVWSVSGQQHVSNSAAYTSVDLDLGAYSASQIRIRATAAGGYTGDIAIDNIEIWDSPAGPVAPTFNSDPLTKVDATQDQPYSDSISSDAIDGNGDALIFSKVSGPAWLSVSDNGDLSGTPQASDVGLNTFVVEVSDGALSNTTTLTININDNSAPIIVFSDNFELGQGNWINVTSGDNKNWTRDSAGTPSSGTGPLSGAGGSSYYMYLETSSGSAYTLGDTAILQGPTISGLKIHLAFKYHMYGANTGTLAVDVFSNSAWIKDVWSISGQQQTSNSIAYTAVDVDLSSYNITQIRFRATAAGGYTGDIAIDDLEISSHFIPGDDDNDGVANAIDQCPNTPSDETANSVGCSPLQVDTDNDGVIDTLDAFPLDPTEWLDTDGDAVGNNADTDDDNDGILDTIDAYDLVSIGTYSDMDGDGAPDTCDSACLTVGMSVDIDVDGNGQIEIYSLNQLNNMRNNLQGTAYNDGGGDNSAGCGDGVNILQCSGYELMNDLNFDEDGDNQNNDTYNTVSGWQPVGDSLNPFDTSFNGNSFVIKNLFIDRATENFVGLFGHASVNAQINNLRLEGALSSITGRDWVGALVGYSYASINNVSSAIDSVSGNDVVGGLIGYNFGPLSYSFTEKGLVTGDDTVGGLAGASNGGSLDVVFSGMSVNTRELGGGLLGSADNSTINNSFSSGSVNGFITIGGHIGYAVNVTISKAYSSGGVVASSGNEVGGLVGGVFYGLTLSEVYWDTVSSGMTVALGSGIFDGDATGLTVTEIRCPTEPEFLPTCASTALYSSWEQLYWDFGSVNDYPGLKINGVTYNDDDLDNDGVSDALDVFPNDINEWADSDIDGVGDNADACDTTPILNSDNDADGCDDATEDLDDDNDGIVDTLDTYPLDFDNDQVDDAIDNCHSIPNLQQLNSDTDNYGDACDVDDDGDGLIEIATVHELNNIQHNRSGTAYDNGSTSNNLGCGDGINLLNCNGYELANTLDFDENKNLIRDDSYNTGAGWSPIGNLLVPFDAIFDGNGYQIQNIYINSSYADYVGLFSYIGSNGLVRNLGMTGSLTSITADIGVSILAGSNYGVITNVYTSGNILSLNYRAGGIASINHGTISNSWSNATVESYDDVGGLVGWNYTGAMISHSYSAGLVTVTGSTGDGGGLVGVASGSIIDSYWDTQVSTQSTGYGALNGTLTGDPTGLTTLQMQCPIAPETQASCYSSALYTLWDTAIWDFGTSSEYPALISNGVLQRGL